MVKVYGNVGWWPSSTKFGAKRLATTLRKRGYKVKITKGTDIFSKTRGIKYNVVVHGKRK